MRAQPMREWDVHGEAVKSAVVLRENHLADLRLGMNGDRHLRRQLLRRAVGALDAGANLFTLVLDRRLGGAVATSVDPATQARRLDILFLEPSRALVDAQAKWLQAVVQRMGGDVRVRAPRFGFMAQVLRRAFSARTRVGFRWRDLPQS